MSSFNDLGIDLQAPSCRSKIVIESYRVSRMLLMSKKWQQKTDFGA
jgi:hypothetical protein